MENEEYIVQAQKIHKKFTYPIENHILRGVDLSVRRGESIAIMGRSGQGKSTLLHILGTLESATSGDIIIGKEPVNFSNKSRIRNKKLAFVFQSFHLLEDFSVLDNVLMPAKIARNDTNKGSLSYKNAIDCLDALGLLNRLHFNIRLLSGGEKQRVAIARALCNDPDVIFADEPTGNLDEQTSLQIQEYLLNCAKIRQKSLVVVTHDTAFASRCDKVYHLENGLLN